MTLEEVQALWFDGTAWCKAVRLADLAPGHDRTLGARQALAALERGDPLQLVQVAVEDWLPGHMRESSSWADLESGPWRQVPVNDVVEQAKGFVESGGCEAAHRALEWFLSQAGLPNTSALRLNSEAVFAVGLVSKDAVTLLFDAG